MSAHFMISVAFTVTLVSFLSTATAGEQPPSTEIMEAVKEMQRGGYYSFAMLVHMVQQDSVPGHVTFLVPTDEALSIAPPPPAVGQVLEFLHMHSIPAPLLFEDLRHLPDGTVIPTNKTGYALEITSGGGSKLGLLINGVELVQANVCVAGFSVRCHGINRVLWANRPLCPAGDGSCIASPPETDSSVSNRQIGGPSGVTLWMYGDMLATFTFLIALFL